LTPNIPFKLTGRAFKFLVEVFLYYDFSVNSFLQSLRVIFFIKSCNKLYLTKVITIGLILTGVYVETLS